MMNTQEAKRELPNKASRKEKAARKPQSDTLPGRMHFDRSEELPFTD
jgi:hypothetical protein